MLLISLKFFLYARNNVYNVNKLKITNITFCKSSDMDEVIVRYLYKKMVTIKSHWSRGF